jgi:hypothetical protein
VKIVSSLCLAKTVAAADWSWFYSGQSPFLRSPQSTAPLTWVGDDTCAVGKNPQPTDFAVVSPRYDINDNKCLYGEPNRTHVWVPGKSFHGTFCHHMSNLDHCLCSDRTLQIDAYSRSAYPLIPTWAGGGQADRVIKECKALPKESFNSYSYTKVNYPLLSFLFI